MKIFFTTLFLAFFVCSAVAAVDESQSNKRVDVSSDISSITVGNTTMGDAVNNAVTISGNASASGDVAASVSDFSATGSSVTVNTTGSISGNVTAARGGVSTNNNTVTVNSGVIFGSVTAGSSNGVANDNTVIINAGTLHGDIFAADAATTNGNSVVINGGHFDGDIYAGTGISTNNSIILNNNADLTVSTLYGNTLTVRGFKGDVNGLSGFDKYNFYLTNVANGDTIINSATTVNLTGSKVNLFFDGKSDLSMGDTITLITNVSGITTLESGKGMAGISRIYDFSLSTSGTALNATLDSYSFNPQTTSLLHGQGARLALHNQSSDMLADLNPIGKNFDWKVFSAVSGGSSSYDLGLDVSGLNMIVGAARTFSRFETGLTIAAFIEAGWGSYDGDISDVKADGDISYYGIGLYERLIFDGKYYVDGSVRGGNATVDYATDDFGTTGGVHASYDSSANYLGAHIGVGRIFGIGESSKVDLYGRFTWLRQSGDSFTIAGDDITLDDASSMRLRGGVKYIYSVTQSFDVQLNGAYDYELDSELKGNTVGYDIKSQDIAGGTVVAGGALMYHPVDTCIGAGVGANGYFGARDGYSVTGQILFRL